jgi:hypothetical protein
MIAIIGARTRKCKFVNFLNNTVEVTEASWAAEGRHVEVTEQKQAGRVGVWSTWHR